MTPAPNQIRRAPSFADTRFTAVQPTERMECTPPDGCDRRFWFVPMYVDTRVSVLRRAVADRYPAADAMVYREPCGEGTAYWIGTYGQAWPLEIDPKDAPMFFREAAVPHA